MALWEVLDDAARPEWSCSPFESVGPIRFGMLHDEVLKAVDGVLDCEQDVWERPETGLSAQLKLTSLPSTAFRPTAVTLYYTDREERLYCIAVDGLQGPQVVLSGVKLVGRVPSVLEREFGELAVAEDAGLCSSLTADVAAEGFGVVLRAQRAGDALLSRPVFVGREWSHRFWDSTDSWIPRAEWHGHW